MICSCRRNGLTCVSACGDCRGIGCANKPEEVGENDSESKDDYEDDYDDGNIFDMLSNF